MTKKHIKLDQFHYHEATDRCNCVNAIIQDMLLDHPVIEQTEEYKKKIAKASSIIGDVYQKISQHL